MGLNWPQRAAAPVTATESCGSASPSLVSFEQAQALMATYGSPLYVYRGDRLQQTIRRITQAVPYPHIHFHFASVTNGNVYLLQRFRQAGWGLHANTPGDMYLGLQAGFRPDQIVYSGSNLSRAEMQQALAWGIATFNWDSLAQLQLFCDVYQAAGDRPAPRLGLRLNLPALTGDSRIGVPPADFAAATRLADAQGLSLSGLHFYRGTGTNATRAFTQVIEAVLAVGQQLSDWAYLDFGGGFGYPYRPGGAAFSWEDFGHELTRQLAQQDRPVELLIEPGRAAIAGCATLLAEVIAVKWQGKKQIVGVNTTVANLSVPSVHGGYREIVPLRSPTLATDGLQYATDVCGNTTYSRDYLGRNCPLPALQPGDLVAILAVGAYGYAMSSHFLHRPRPAEVWVEGQTQRLIRQREDYSTLLTHQVFEP
ncbi:MAG: diaminopimelate decarboxylase family protein [Leptolyngbyaceae cyanobacterium]